GEVFYLLLPCQLRGVLEFCLDSVGDVAPGEPDHRILIDDEFVHFEDCMVDPVVGGLSDLFDIGSRISRRRADAIEKHLLEIIEKREMLLPPHFHPDAVSIGGISHATLFLTRVFLRSSDVTVAKRDQSRRAESWHLT